jgi:ribosomal protein L37E
MARYFGKRTVEVMCRECGKTSHIAYARREGKTYYFYDTPQCFHCGSEEVE